MPINVLYIITLITTGLWIIGYNNAVAVTDQFQEMMIAYS